MSQTTAFQKHLDLCNNDACHRFVGIHAVSLDKKKAIIELPLQSHHINFENCVHGGMLSFLIDTTMGFAVYPHLVESERILAIDLKVSYLKAGLLSMKVMRCEANLVSRTRRLAVSEGSILAPDGEILCKGLGTYSVLTRK